MQESSPDTQFSQYTFTTRNYDYYTGGKHEDRQKLFTLALEGIFKNINWQYKGVITDGVRVNHLRFTDDIILISTSSEELKTMLIELQMILSKTKI